MTKETTPYMSDSVREWYNTLNAEHDIHVYNDDWCRLAQWLDEVDHPIYRYTIRMKNDCPYLQVWYIGTCNRVEDEWIGKSAKHMLSWHMTKSELVQKCLKVSLEMAEHNIREQFTYRGRSIYDPHYDCDKLWELRGGDNLDERRVA